MNKECIEIEAKEGVDVIALSAYIAGLKSVKKCYVVTGQSIRIYYDADRIAVKKLVKAVGSYSAKGSRGRKANLSSVKQIS